MAALCALMSAERRSAYCGDTAGKEEDNEEPASHLGDTVHLRFVLSSLQTTLHHDGRRSYALICPGLKEAKKKSVLLLVCSTMWRTEC